MVWNVVNLIAQVLASKICSKAAEHVIMLNMHTENSNYETSMRKLKESSEVCTGMVQFLREF